MKPAQSHRAPTLRIVPKPVQVQAPLRQLDAHHGILWEMIPVIFERYHWEIQEQTDLFIKVYHSQTHQSVIISRIGHGTVLVNHDYDTFSATEIHEIESLADIQTEKKSTNPYSPIKAIFFNVLMIMRMML